MWNLGCNSQLPGIVLVDLLDFRQIFAHFSPKFLLLFLPDLKFAKIWIQLENCFSCLHYQSIRLSHATALPSNAFYTTYFDAKENVRHFCEWIWKRCSHFKGVEEPRAILGLGQAGGEAEGEGETSSRGLASHLHHQEEEEGLASHHQEEGVWYFGKHGQSSLTGETPVLSLL